MPTRARIVMVQGTASGVGKSWITTALCRILRRRGYRVAPFKAQNMSNNAAVTAAGGEVGRAQAIQAEAAGVEIDERMNPVLLKPIADDRSDVVVMGASRPDLSRTPWMERRGLLWPVVTEALDGLREEFDWVVVEGAGSPAEVNLRASDIVNMAVARYADAPVLLVADIDRGGAFASLVGTWQLLEAEDRARIRGFALNRFRGDPELLGDAPEVVLRHTGVPVLGVVPWIRTRLPEEDAAALEREGDRRPSARARPAPVAAVRLPRIANFDDLLPLDGAHGPGIRWVDHPSELDGARAVVLPGTRNVIGDLRWLHRTGLARAVRALVASGGAVLGLCGGFQMLGSRVSDPSGIEEGGDQGGLGLLPLETELAPDKSVRRVLARWNDGAGPEGELVGYEIHHGRTHLLGGSRPDPLMRDASDPDVVLGYRQDRVWGTYVHGCLKDTAFRARWLAMIGLPAPPSTPGPEPDPIDEVADAVSRTLDLDTLLGPTEAVS